MWNKPAAGFWQGRIIVILLLCFVAGILLAAYTKPTLLLCCIAVGVALLLPLPFFLLRRLRPLLFLPLALALGAFFCAGQQGALDAWTFSDGHHIIVCGKVRAISSDEDGWRATLKVSSADGQPLRSADIYLYGEGAAPAPGSSVEARGTVFSPEPYANTNAFDYRLYLRQEGIAGAVSVVQTGRISVLRQGPAFSFSRIGARLEANLREAATDLSGGQRALVFGVFLGDKSGLTYEMKNVLGLTGALDAFAVSGVHVGFIVLMALMLVGGGYRRRLPRFLVCLAMLAVYCSLTGASASVLRSSLMALILLAATLFDEQYDGVTALALAAFVCLAFRPLWLFSAGFQLSFAAAAGAIILTPAFRQLMSPLPKLLRDFFSVTFAATLTILPLISYYFYHISWLGWLLAPLLVLASGVTVMLSFAATVIAMISPAVAGLFLAAASYAMEAAYWVCAAWSKFSLTASITGAVAGWTVALFLASLFLMPWLLRRMGARAGWALLLLILPLFTLGAPKSVAHQPTLPGPLTEIVFIDVGQGDCVLVITPDRQTILIDGGGNAWAPGSVGEYSLLPYLKSRGITRIDLMINSHPHADHTDGLLSVLTYLDVTRLIYTDIWQGEEYGEQLLALATDQETELQACRAGDFLAVGDYVRLNFYYPAPGMETAEEINDNNGSLVFELSCGDIDILFNGDIDGELLSQVCAAALAETEIVKVPHHGSKSGYAADLAPLLESEAAIISVGRDNSYGHPAAKVVEYWQEHGEVYRTDSDGSVSLFTNGTEYQILTYH